MRRRSASLTSKYCGAKTVQPCTCNLKAQTSIIKVMTEELKQIADLITANTIFCTKEVLTSEEAAKYCGLSRSYLYKLTMNRQIPHYKGPMGKMCYFNRKELEQWLQSNRVIMESEINQQAQSYCVRNRIR
ncbi:hypothetical protein C825_001137 [Parabacteroides sp. ASF519]|uniref:Excisionase family DNA binding domain-containing protein n=3 Tax=Parabacteroides TaxID=375288 RepID=S0GN72_9BACT|nr:excisionase family DNA binding domain-containing protein [Parabacteroides goldsteinii dnLKV18]KAI4359106.1 hypothetical protein C825_001137 [Parabacteroides sp. ASF519]